jgi:hypothetical protein
MGVRLIYCYWPCDLCFIGQFWPLASTHQIEEMSNGEGRAKKGILSPGTIAAGRGKELQV